MPEVFESSRDTEVLDKGTEGQETGQEGQEQATGGSVEQGGEGQADENLPFHKHPRFTELTRQLKETQGRLSEYEQREQERQLASQQKEDPTLKELLDMGFGGPEAKRMLKVIDILMEKKISPFKSEHKKEKIETVFKDFASEHKDITNEIWGEMNNIFDTFSKEEQTILAKNPKSLRMVYAEAKTNLNTDFEKGQEAALKQTKNKREGGIFKGSPVKTTGELTDEMIEKMSASDFAKNRAQIYKKVHEIEAAG